jgi:DNA-directed RNA polymerase subunit RPC12/RpoP
MEKAYVCNKCGVVFEPKNQIIVNGDPEYECPVCKMFVSIHRTELAEFGD